MSTVEISTVTSLFDLAVQVRGVAEDILATTPGGTPDLSYVAPSRPVFDCCPALIVWVPSLSEESTSPISPLPGTGQRPQLGRINLAAIEVVVLRCGPVLTKKGQPEPGSNEAVAEIVLADGWALWTGFYTAIKTGAFKSLCDVVHWDTGQYVLEQGGCVGWRFTMRASIAGILD